MKILVGISGSIGVLGIHAHLISLMMEEEVEEVRAVMTPTAARFLNPRALESFLRHPVHVDPWTDPGPGFSPPDLVQGVDLYLVAPASATTLSRCAAGSAENLVASCYLAHTGPVAFAPVMSREMWEHPAVLRNLALLKKYGACLLPPGKGYLVTARKHDRGAICPYPVMWSRLKALVDEKRVEGRPVEENPEDERSEEETQGRGAARQTPD